MTKEVCIQMGEDMLTTTEGAMTKADYVQMQEDMLAGLYSPAHPTHPRTPLTLKHTQALAARRETFLRMMGRRDLLGGDDDR